jgi:hypothetical protein
MRSDGIFDLTRAEYEAVERERFSVLSHMAQSPAHYRWARSNASESTDAMALGTAAHVAIFEPQHLPRYQVWDGRRAGKKWEEFLAQHGEENILTREQWDRAIHMGGAVRLNPEAMQHLEAGKPEASVLWTHREPGIGGVKGYEIALKARLDWLGEAAILDLKTCRDASFDAFSRAAWDRRMHVQGAMYQDAVQAVTGRKLPFVILAVENTEPFVVQMYEVPSPLLERGRREYRDWLATLAVCREHEVWPGYANGPVELDLPKWVKDYEEAMS